MIKFVDKFLDKKQLKKVYDYYDALIFKNDDKLVREPKNSQVPNAIYMYNNVVSNYIMLTKLKLVEKQFGEKLIPTYSFVRQYSRGMELKKHIDRSACEMSLTLNIWQDENWPIYFEKDKKKIEIYTEPGQAALYEGCIYPHWREKYKGESYLQIFMHYVRAKGKNTDHYLDGLGKLDYPKEIYKKWL